MLGYWQSTGLLSNVEIQSCYRLIYNAPLLLRAALACNAIKLLPPFALIRIRLLVANEPEIDSNYLLFITNSCKLRVH